MAKTPEFVVTGLHVPGLQIWARVLVAPERLQHVKRCVLTMGQVFLKPGEVLEIDTQPADDIERALTVGDPSEEKLAGACLVAWNSTGDITVYADDADHVAAIAEPVTSALTTELPRELRSKSGCWLESHRIASIRVGDVQVFFPRKDREESEDEPAENDPDLYPSRLLAGGDLRAPRGVKVSDYGRGAV